MTTILFVLISLFSCAQDSENLDWLMGSWEGKGVQIDDATWKIELNAESETSIKISYPDLGCGGVWNRIEDDVEGLQYVESITLGLRKCDQGVEVVVSKIDENTIKLVYYLRAYDPNNPIAEATMYRQ